MHIPDHLAQTILQTRRLYLREISPAILQYLFSTADDNAIAKYLGAQTLEELQIERNKFTKGFTTHAIDYKIFTLVDKISGDVVGKCGYHTWYPAHMRAEIGYGMVADRYKAQGFMTEALEAIIEYGFESMGLNRIEALIGPGNVPSIQLVKRLGFVEEGTLREHYRKGNTVYDSICYALLKMEYQVSKHSLLK